MISYALSEYIEAAIAIRKEQNTLAVMRPSPGPIHPIVHCKAPRCIQSASMGFQLPHVYICLIVPPDKGQAFAVRGHTQIVEDKAGPVRDSSWLPNRSPGVKIGFNFPDI